MKPDRIIYVKEQSQAAESRRAAAEISAELEFERSAAGRLAIAVTEAATNLVRHAVNGRIIIHLIRNDNLAGIDILAIDDGPGIPNVSEAMRDGFSTVGGVGTGFGSIMRQADLFDIYSVPGAGTVILARVWSRRTYEQKKRRLDWEALCFAYPGEEASGDTYASYHENGRHLFMMADGLGHGTQAAEASREAAKAFYEHSHHHGPQQIIEAAHGRLRSTRGAAVTVVSIDSAKRELVAAGIGNVSAAVVTPEGTKRIITLDGIVGERYRKVAEFTYTFDNNATLVMHTDGLSSRWDIDRPGLLPRSAGVIAGVLLREQYRERDDAAVLVVKNV